MGSFSIVVRWYLAGCLARCGGSRFHLIGYIELTNSGRDGIVGGGRKAGKPTKRRKGGGSQSTLGTSKIEPFSQVQAQLGMAATLSVRQLLHGAGYTPWGASS